MITSVFEVLDKDVKLNTQNLYTSASEKESINQKLTKQWEY